MKLSAAFSALLAGGISACSEPPSSPVFGPGEAPTVPISSCDDVSQIASRLFFDSVEQRRLTVDGRGMAPGQPGSPRVEVRRPGKLGGGGDGETVVVLSMTGLRRGFMPADDGLASLSYWFETAAGVADDPEVLTITTGEVDVLRLAEDVGERTCGVASVRGQGDEHILELVVWFDAEYI